MAIRKVFIYARDSMGNLDAIDRQLDTLREYAAANDYEVVNEYADIDGWENYDRPGVDRLLKDAAEAGCDAVLCVASNRLARKRDDLQRWWELFHSANLTLIFMDIDSNLAWQLMDPSL